MSKKSIEEYTDKELEKAINLIETIIKGYKQIKLKDKEKIKILIKAEEILEEHLKKLHAERSRRIKKGEYSPDP